MSIGILCHEYKKIAALFPANQIPPVAVAGSRDYSILPSITTPFITILKDLGIKSVSVGCANGVDKSILNACINNNLNVNYYRARQTFPCTPNSHLITIAYTSPSSVSYPQALAIRTVQCVKSSCLLIVFSRNTSFGKGTSLAIKTAKGIIPVILIMNKKASILCA